MVTFSRLAGWWLTAGNLPADVAAAACVVPLIEFIHLPKLPCAAAVVAAAAVIPQIQVAFTNGARV